MTQQTRETERIRFPKCATERAILAVIANWHFVGVLRELNTDEPATEAA